MNAPTRRDTPAVATLETPMADVQSLADLRRLAIDKVGVKNVVYPISLKMPCGKSQTTVATIDMYVSLPHDRKGTHMSRFLESLNEHRDCIRPEQSSRSMSTATASAPSRSFRCARTCGGAWTRATRTFAWNSRTSSRNSPPSPASPG